MDTKTEDILRGLRFLLSDSADRSTLFYLSRIMQDAFVESPSKYAHMHNIS